VEGGASLTSKNPAMTTALVGLGGLIGVLGRYGITRLTLHTDALLWSTVGINVVGSFLLGLLAAEHWFSRDVREAIGVGLLGGFTTFSTFSVQVVLETDGGKPGKAALYVAASVFGGIAAAAAGYALGRRLA
jgi:fluoride exporter